MKNQEVWKDVKNYNGDYQVSNLGNVRSFVKYKVGGRILKKTIGSHGYYTSSLRCKNILIHRLVAESFVDNKLNLPCVNHKNGIKTDNRLSNLEWCTYSDNNKHAFDTGLKKKGKSLYNSKLTKEKVIEIRKLKGVLTQTEIAKKFNVSVSLISAVMNNKKWAYV